MAYIPSSGSVVAFQSNPSALQVLIQSPISINTASISGQVGASVIGLPPVNINVGGNPVTTANPVPVQPPASGSLPVTQVGSVITVGQGSIATVIIGGSITASFTPPANQSVSGAVSISNFPTNQNISGSVVAWLESTNASVITVGSPVANQSVSGTVGASVIGHAPVIIVGGSILTSAPANQSVSGTVSISNFPTTQNVSGSIVAFQGTPEWTVKSSLAGGIFPISGSVAAVVTNTNLNVSGSVVAFEGGGWSGSVAAVQIGTWKTSITNIVPTSMLVGASIFGQLPAGTAMLGSIATYQGAVPWATVNVGSIITTQIGSVITKWGQSPSIVGTYAEDSAHTSADKGLFILGVRNDTVSSFTGSNQEYNPFAHDSAGRMLIKPFAPGEASIIANTSIVSAGTIASVQLFSAPGAGLKNYITDFNISNSGAATTVVLFADSDSSIQGRTIAPAGGGSNHSYATPLVSARVNTVTNLHILSSSSIVYATVTGFKAP